MKKEIVHYAIITVFVSLYALVATISMINSVAFFDLAHNGAMSWILAVGFELGAAASLAALIILDRTNKTMVWGLFILLTAFQMMANSFHAYINLEEYRGWIELFGLERQTPIAQKRILSAISGAVLPIVALGFIKSLVDYIRPDVDDAANSTLIEIDNQKEITNTESFDEDHANDMVLNAMLDEVGDDFLDNEINNTAKEQQSVKAEQPPKKPAQPSQSGTKKMTPTKSNNVSMTMKKNMNIMPIAGSPPK
jgi:hypothetical protein